MDVVSDLPSDAQPEKPVQQREALFDDPTQLAQPGAVLGATAGDDRRDAEFADKTAVAVVVVAAVGVDLRRLAARSPRVCRGSAVSLAAVAAVGSRHCGCRRSAAPPTGFRRRH